MSLGKSIYDVAYTIPLRSIIAELYVHKDHIQKLFDAFEKACVPTITQEDINDIRYTFKKLVINKITRTFDKLCKFALNSTGDDQINCVIFIHLLSQWFPQIIDSKKFVKCIDSTPHYDFENIKIPDPDLEYLLKSGRTDKFVESGMIAPHNMIEYPPYMCIIDWYVLMN